MKKLAGLTIASLCTIALGGTAVDAHQVEAHPALAEPDQFIVIEKELPDEYDAELPQAWAFRLDSAECAVFFSPGQGFIDSLVVDVEAAGGETDPIAVVIFGSTCDVRIIEVAVDGWEPVNPAGGVAQITLEPTDGDQPTDRVVFSNRPVPPETTTTTTEPEVTTTTVAETTTTVADTTTTVADTTTTPAPTTAPPTTAGTVAPELPATGSSNALTGLLAGLLILGGLGAVVASRRT